MSRINDALKRAKRAQRQTLSGLTPLPPMAPKPSLPKLPPGAPRPGGIIKWILPGVIGFLVVAACLFIGLALATRMTTKAVGEPKPLAVQQLKPAAIPAPNPAPNTPTPPPPSPPAPPEPKLQGIVYAPTQPWAIVDGRTVHVGDRLGEFRVKAISQRDVTLEKTGGSQKKLGLSN
ncbi:MAG: hypothetical protein ABSB84_05210 [Verrucomicrobiota bacterium]|jgi:hypothetical protein